MQRDIEEFVSACPFRHALENTRFLITGTTGLIGSVMTHCLLALNTGITIVALVRNLKKAVNTFTEEERKHIDFIECDLSTFDYRTVGRVDYIVHGAAPTASRFMVDYPVETFNIIIDATRNLLEYAKANPVKGMVQLSSLEVYGVIHDDTEPVAEEFQGYLDPLAVRSSYPMGKRAAETMCALYAAEYGIRVMVARLTQTTGAGVADNDSRVIVQFSRLAARGEDIIMHSHGKAARPYCYTTDAIEALLYILLLGNGGEAYNVANADAYVSAVNLAEFIRDNFNRSINVRYELNENMGYAPETKLRLATGKLKQLGWSPKHNLRQIIGNLIESLK